MLKTIVRLPFRMLRIEAPIHASIRFLREEGWSRSYREGLPVRRDGEPIPWYTYAAIAFLEERLPADATVFEFGAGYSTLWYAARCAHVRAVEPHHDWIDRLTVLLPSNAEIIHAAETDAGLDDYLDALRNAGGRFDVIAIDSWARYPAGLIAPDYLTDRGVIVWDNGDHPKLARLKRELYDDAGFRELPLVGLTPIVPSFDKTSILYRDGNLLGI